ncbi:hypothetical protein EDD21DRAFT_391511 [Dissophora ornata]|nr:hypothetical protein EDD21DRAFT_391511 [Dissophora ornata]
MYTGYLNNWPPRIPSSPGSNALIETLGDLHQSRTASPTRTPRSPDPPQPHLLPRSNSNPPRPSYHSASYSASAPTSPWPDDTRPTRSLPSGTDLVSAALSLPTTTATTTTTAPPTTHPPRTLSANSIKTDGLALKNVVSGGLLSSPASIPGTSYFPHLVAPSNAPDMAKDFPVASLVRGDSLESLPITRNNGSGNTGSKSQQVFHHLATMGMAQPPRFTGGSNTNSRVASPSAGSAAMPQAETNNSQLQLDNFTKSPIVSKPSKKGIKNKFKKLQRNRGSGSRDNSAANTFITSGESDSEAALELERDSTPNSGGIASPFMPSTPGSRKSTLSYRSKQPRNDSGLPPKLPPRSNTNNNTINNTGTMGYGKSGLSGPEYGHESHKEISAGRFKDLFKNVGPPNQHFTGPTSTFSPNSDHNGIQIGTSRPLQSRSTFHVFGDFLSGDDQSSTSKGFRIKGPSVRRKKRRTKKPHSVAAGMLAPFAAGVTDDEDSSTSRSGHHHNTHRHSFFHLHNRRRSRSIGEGGQHTFPITWNEGPRISPALEEARRLNPDPNLLVAELEPLPTSFKNVLATLSPSKNHQQHQQPYYNHYPQVPLATYITPSSTAGSGLAALYSGSLGTPANYQNNSPMQRSTTCSDTLNTKTFLFNSYQNTIFQGHYIFRVVEDRVEYKKLPVSLEQACSQYFREADVTYRALEKKAKTLKEEERSRKRIDRLIIPGYDELRRDNTLPPSEPSKGKSRGPDFFGGGSNFGRRNSGSMVLKSAPARDQMRLTDTLELLGSRVTGYLDQRYDPESSSNPIFRSITGGPDRSRSEPVEKDMISSHNGISSQPIPYRSPLYHSRRRSWSSIHEQPRVDLESQEAIEANSKEMERKYHEEFQQATYRLEIILAKIIKGSEYEKFDDVADVTIVKDNRDTAVFSIANGDRTNTMWLESPSWKLKCEFLNWIAISTMNHGEPESDQTVAPQPKVISRSNLDMFLGLAKIEFDENAEDSDLLIELIEVRLSHQLEKLQLMRESIQSTVQQIEGCLSQLDHIDDGAKKMVSSLDTAIDSQDLRLALKPSPTTGLTLAETVEWKLKDVSKKILMHKKIMDIARFDLYRLEHEIELEKRSVKLFRQYKIIIAIVSISIVFLVWFLYHSRANAMAPQLPSPLFATPVNPFETGYNFHHGEPPVMTPQLPSPSSSPTVVDIKFEKSANSGSTAQTVSVSANEPKAEGHDNAVDGDDVEHTQFTVVDEVERGDTEWQEEELNQIVRQDDDEMLVAQASEVIQEVLQDSPQDENLERQPRSAADNTSHQQYQYQNQNRGQKDDYEQAKSWPNSELPSPTPPLSNEKRSKQQEKTVQMYNPTYANDPSLSQVPCELLPVQAQMDCMVSEAALLS